MDSDGPTLRLEKGALLGTKPTWGPLSWAPAQPPPLAHWNSAGLAPVLTSGPTFLWASVVSSGKWE